MQARFESHSFNYLCFCLLRIRTRCQKFLVSLRKLHQLCSTNTSVALSSIFLRVATAPARVLSLPRNLTTRKTTRKRNSIKELALILLARSLINLLSAISFARGTLDYIGLTRLIIALTLSSCVTGAFSIPAPFATLLPPSVCTSLAGVMSVFILFT